MRHAKSDWKTNALSDHDRPLNQRGKRDAPLIAERMLELHWEPQLVISSDSLRTQETWQRMDKIFPNRPNIVFSPQLYHGTVEDIQAVVSTVSNEAQTVMVLGHNPGWENALTFLSGESHTMTTANAALLTHAGKEWRAAIQTPASWRLFKILRPKEL